MTGIITPAYPVSKRTGSDGRGAVKQQPRLSNPGTTGVDEEQGGVWIGVVVVEAVDAVAEDAVVQAVLEVDPLAGDQRLGREPLSASFDMRDNPL
jgi:hypothetical protein